ncbi:MAG: response regulator transcription factor [Rhodanobacteraceae bacterium]|nr:response regulator transcription factor [Rhodanobacteraceae bacterium]
MSKHEMVIGFLEDDADQAELISLWLDGAGYTPRVFRSASEFRRRLGIEVVDLLLLDWMLPDATGLDVLAWIRGSANAELPVIFLTSRSMDEDIVKGLESGGDDYVVKPPKQAELLARVAAVLRRRGVDPDSNADLNVPPYHIDMTRRRVAIDGRDIELTQREFDLAIYLFRRQGRIVRRDALLENVWNMNAQVSTRTVDTHVSRLRKKLELSGEHGWRLIAVYQHGYRLEQA